MRSARLRHFYWIAALVSAPVFAETITFVQQPSTVAYKVASNSWAVQIRHPFRVIQVSGTNLGGELWFTPGQLKQGMKYHLDFPIGSVPWPDQDLRQQVLQFLGSVIAVQGTSVDLIRWPVREDVQAILETHPNVRANKRTFFPSVRIRSIEDGRVVQWSFSSEFALTDLGIQVPSLWGIPGEDKVTVTGEVSFTPKD